MAETTRQTLTIEGYTADVHPTETVVTATGRSYDQRDERSYELVLRVPTDDLLRVSNLLSDAHDAARAMPCPGCSEPCGQCAS